MSNSWKRLNNKNRSTKFNTIKLDNPVIDNLSVNTIGVSGFDVTFNSDIDATRHKISAKDVSSTSVETSVLIINKQLVYNTTNRIIDGSVTLLSVSAENFSFAKVPVNGTSDNSFFIINDVFTDFSISQIRFSKTKPNPLGIKTINGVTNILDVNGGLSTDILYLSGEIITICGGHIQSGGSKLGYWDSSSNPINNHNNLFTDAIYHGGDVNISGNVDISGNITVNKDKFKNEIGYDCSASGDYSFAMGYNTIAKGKFSVAMGHTCVADQIYSFAMGSGTTASGSTSTAMGTDTTASGSYSTAMGYNTTASGDYSVAMGHTCVADEIYSFAMGSGTTASGSTSTAMGQDCSAIGICSTAMGYYTTATGNYSVAMGEGTDASGICSTAMGADTTASGDYSFAMGYQTTASGDYSVAMGNGAYAGKVSDGSYIQFAVGTSKSMLNDDATDLSNNNSFVIYDDGHAQFYKNVTIDKTLTLSGQVITVSGGHIQSDGNNLGYWSKNPTGGIQHHFTEPIYHGGNVTIGGNLLGQDCSASGQNSVAIGNRAYAGGDIQFAVGASTNTLNYAATELSNNNSFVIYENGDASFNNNVKISKDLFVNGNILSRTKIKSYSVVDNSYLPITADDLVNGFLIIKGPEGGMGGGYNPWGLRLPKPYEVCKLLKNYGGAENIMFEFYVEHTLNYNLKIYTHSNGTSGYRTGEKNFGKWKYVGRTRSGGVYGPSVIENPTLPYTNMNVNVLKSIIGNKSVRDGVDTIFKNTYSADGYWGAMTDAISGEDTGNIVYNTHYSGPKGWIDVSNSFTKFICRIESVGYDTATAKNAVIVIYTTNNNVDVGIDS